MKRLLYFVAIAFIFLSAVTQGVKPQDQKPKCPEEAPSGSKAQEKPPWFEPDEGCQRREKIAASGNSVQILDRAGWAHGTLWINICGTLIRKDKDYKLSEGWPAELDSKNVTRHEVCCDKWFGAMYSKTKKPCDVLKDIDCDGTPNEADDRPVDPQKSLTCSECNATVRSLSGGKDFDQGTVQVISDGMCPEQRSIVVSASVAGGASREIGVFSSGAGKNSDFFYMDVDPCGLPGGSDLPGTKVAVKASVLGDDGVEIVLANTVITLGPDTLEPLVGFYSIPALGSKVFKAGDKIDLKVTAQELLGGSTWQTGVMQIQVLGPDGVVGTPATFNSYRAKSCLAKSWRQPYAVTYTVPKNPPRIIKLCAIADDFEGKQGISCQGFPTGNR